MDDKDNESYTLGYKDTIDSIEDDLFKGTLSLETDYNKEEEEDMVIKNHTKRKFGDSGWRNTKISLPYWMMRYQDETSDLLLVIVALIGGVRYNNLKKEAALNMLSAEEMTNLWLPYVIYDNTDYKETTSFAEWKWRTDLMVNRTYTPWESEDDFIRSGLEEVAETEIVDGATNTLVMI